MDDDFKESDHSVDVKPHPRARKIPEQTDVRLSGLSVKVDSSPNAAVFTLPIRIKRWIIRRFRKYHLPLNIFWLILLLALLMLYMHYAIALNWAKTENDCEGIKLLCYVTILSLISVSYFLGFKPLIGDKVNACCITLVSKVRNLCPFLQSRVFSIVFGCIICCLITLIIIIISDDLKYRLISFGGVIVLVGLGYLFSKQRQLVDWKLIVWGLTVQFVFACLLLRWQPGRLIIECVSNKVVLFIMYTDHGSEKIFGYLATSKLEFENRENFSQQQIILAFKIFPIVIFFSLTTSILFYYGILQWLIIKLGCFFQMVIGSTAIESMTAAANIFLGMTEAPLTVKPYLKKLTLSEIHSVMTSGFATIAGTVLVAFIAMGISGTHLLTASLLSSPAALIFSKLMYPEMETSVTTSTDIAKLQRRSGEQSVLEAAVRGVNEGVTLYGNILANLICFLSLIKMVDLILEELALLVGVESFNSELILAYCFTPFAFIMGIEWHECAAVAELIGIKTVINEFVAFIRLLDREDDLKLSYRSQMIATYALCGFSNLASIGVMIGGFGALVPERLSDITALAFRAMIAGSAACFLTACIAGIIMEDYY